MSGNAMETKGRRKSGRPAVITKTLDALANMGYPLAAKVETYNHITRQRNDLFGLADLYAVGPDLPHRFVQVCLSDVGAHKKKYEDAVLNRRLIALLSSPQTAFEIWAWRRIKLKRGGVAIRWQPRIIRATLVGDVVLWEEQENGC